ncbi:lysophospholipid acyltransferase family protein [Rhodococcus chondri]|uniref:Lysophospholipid acyltransferase family protein n=1 Tax=Rhodococcus chondri TaxID=3065941 RepID=A0ABU7JXL8_9NOCA|nr:lysophospholipid acyltransferase family protein [Rhodococcus sp. CC-R104]MEE2034755.1 lysophospholipid acyltransferase family protein [Rhodococcus sp. CC-R104]
MTGRVHAWMPVSPCGSGCLPSHQSRVNLLTALARSLVVLVALASAPLLTAGRLLPAEPRRTLQRRYARTLLRCVGLRLTVVDRRDRRGYDGGILVVAPHVSWTDVLVLTAVAPAGFVARADLLEWGVLGSLARRMRVIPIDRQRLRRLPEVVDRIRERLHAGERVAVFPEGTTWCGRAYGGFRSALFEAAIAAECPVQPVGLRYLDHVGEPTCGPAFVGDESIVASMRRLIRSRGTVAEVVLAPLEWPGNDRRDLAARCERAARADRPTRIGHKMLLPESTAAASGEVGARYA